MSRLWCILFFLVFASLSRSSEVQEVDKRRIGMRLPNMLHYRPTTIEKRRIGMRLPNIIYLRNEPEKKNNWDLVEVEEELLDAISPKERIQSGSSEQLGSETQQQHVVYNGASRRKRTLDRTPQKPFSIRK